MGIRVKHGANPSAVLAASFMGGQQKARGAAAIQGAAAVSNAIARREERAAQERSAIRAATKAFERQQTMAGQQMDFRREQDTTAYERAVEQATVANARRAEQATIAHGRGLELMGDQQENQLELMRERQALGEEMYEFKLTADQKAEAEKYRSGLAKLNQRDDLTPEQKQIAKERLWGKLQGIQPIPARKEPSKYPAGQGIGQVWMGDGGLILTRDKDGQPKKLGETNVVRDRLDAYKMLQESLTKEVGDKVVSPEHKDIMKLIPEILGMGEEGATIAGPVESELAPSPAGGANQPVVDEPGGFQKSRMVRAPKPFKVAGEKRKVVEVADPEVQRMIMIVRSGGKLTGDQWARLREYYKKTK